VFSWFSIDAYVCATARTTLPPMPFPSRRRSHCPNHSTGCDTIRKAITAYNAISDGTFPLLLHPPGPFAIALAFDASPRRHRRLQMLRTQQLRRRRMGWTEWDVRGGRQRARNTARLACMVCLSSLYVLARCDSIQETLADDGGN
jgi:hypothetical protein